MTHKLHAPKLGAFGNKVVREDVLAAFNRGDKAALVSIMPEPVIEPHVSSPPPPVPPQHRATAITPPQQPASPPQPQPAVARPRPNVAIAPRPVTVVVSAPPIQVPFSNPAPSIPAPAPAVPFPQSRSSSPPPAVHKNLQADTSLFLAIQEVRFDDVMSAIRTGANPNAIDDFPNSTVLGGYFVRKGLPAIAAAILSAYTDLRIVEYLFNCEADLNVKVTYDQIGTCSLLTVVKHWRNHVFTTESQKCQIDTIIRFLEGNGAV